MDSRAAASRRRRGSPGRSITTVAWWSRPAGVVPRQTGRARATGRVYRRETAHNGRYKQTIGRPRRGGSRRTKRIAVPSEKKKPRRRRGNAPTFGIRCGRRARRRGQAFLGWDGMMSCRPPQPFTNNDACRGRHVHLHSRPIQFYGGKKHVKLDLGDQRHRFLSSIPQHSMRHNGPDVRHHSARARMDEQAERYMWHGCWWASASAYFKPARKLPGTVEWMLQNPTHPCPPWSSQSCPSPVR